MPPVENLIRATQVIAANSHLRLSSSKVTRLCRDYVNFVAGKGVSFGQYLANAVALTAAQRTNFDAAYYRLCYRDPTGESAVRNVMREGAR